MKVRPSEIIVPDFGICLEPNSTPNCVLSPPGEPVERRGNVAILGPPRKRDNQPFNAAGRGEPAPPIPVQLTADFPTVLQDQTRYVPFPASLSARTKLGSLHRATTAIDRAGESVTSTQWSGSWSLRRLSGSRRAALIERVCRRTRSGRRISRICCHRGVGVRRLHLA